MTTMWHERPTRHLSTDPEGINPVRRDAGRYRTGRPDGPAALIAFSGEHREACTLEETGTNAGLLNVWGCGNLSLGMVHPEGILKK